MSHNIRPAAGYWGASDGGWRLRFDSWAMGCDRKEGRDWREAGKRTVAVPLILPKHFRMGDLLRRLPKAHSLADSKTP